MPYRTRLRSTKTKVSAAMSGAADAMIEQVAEASQELVPVDTGDLKRSMRIHKMRGGGRRISYGSPKVRYAAIVHNKPGVRYKKGQWQYLRTPLMASRKLLVAAAKGAKQKLG